MADTGAPAQQQGSTGKAKVTVRCEACVVAVALSFLRRKCYLTPSSQPFEGYLYGINALYLVGVLQASM